MIIAVDIDGILTNETEGHDYMSRTPNFENIDKVNELGIHHIIILYTARYECDRKDTECWLYKYQVKYNELVMNKLKYDILIDDLAYNTFEKINKR